MIIGKKDIPLYVLHELEVGATLLDLLDGTRGDGVDQMTQNHAILQHILIPGTIWVNFRIYKASSTIPLQERTKSSNCKNST